MTPNIETYHKLNKFVPEGKSTNGKIIYTGKK